MSEEAPRSSSSPMQHLANPSFGQERSKLGTYHAPETALPVKCRLSYSAEDLCWLCVCHDYPLLSWKQVASAESGLSSLLLSVVNSTQLAARIVFHKFGK